MSLLRKCEIYLIFLLTMFCRAIVNIFCRLIQRCRLSSQSYFKEMYDIFAFVAKLYYICYRIFACLYIEDLNSSHEKSVHAVNCESQDNPRG